VKDWQEMCDKLLDSLGTKVARQGRPMWIKVFSPAGGAAGGGDPVVQRSADPDALLGWVAGEDCQAVGVVATGRLRPVDEISGYTATASAGREERGRAETLSLACVVGRDGQVGWRVRVPDGAAPADPPTEGRLLDCLRRCFALPTSPPPVEPAYLMATAWLISVLEATAEPGATRLTWSEVTRLHPLARVLAGDLPDGCSHLAPALCRLVASAWTWDDYRRLASDSDCLGELCPSDLAAWMDDGMFARWMLGSLPDTEELLTAARVALVPSAARRLAHAVRAPDEQFAPT
jgi:hypothetical protein